MTEQEKVIEVLERLLESLGRPDRNRGGWKGTNFWADKILALVGGGEPVGWRVERINETGGYLLLTHPSPLLEHYRALGKRTDPLYLRPPAGERDHLTDEFRGTMQYHIDRLLRSPRPVKHGGVPMVDCRDVEHAAKALQRLLDDAILGEQEKGEGDV